MHVSGIPHHSIGQGSQIHGNKGGREDAAPTTPPTDPVDITILSKEATAALENDESPRPGKSGASPAHLAKMERLTGLAEGLTGSAFGHRVSEIARGIEPTEQFGETALTEGDDTVVPVAPVEPDGDETPPPGDDNDPPPDDPVIGDLTPQVDPPLDPLLDLLLPPEDPDEDPPEDPIGGTG